ncbi:chitin synthase [Rickenella mellea]|uniref:chitin synthase n=1 Tax=Rickenella mellea TaxID=50990 RepID=A0A4R5XG57_9AGAM|nr:chitin synthase [Rickenella mellea]
MASTSPAVSSGELTDLVASTGTTTVYPSDDNILSVLQARFRADLPYTRINSSSIVVVNPLKALANVNDVSAKEYEDRCYKDTSLPTVESPKALQPHLYELAAKVYLVMRRKMESQAVIFRGITGSGKSHSSSLLVNQLLRLSAHSKKESRIAEQIKGLSTLLDSFGNAKTLVNPNASRHGRYLELHFNDRSRITSAKVLTFGLDKSRLNRLSHEERSFHIFYQLLAGATSEERDRLNLEDPSDYALLSSSGCYRLPGGPFSDDAAAMAELRAVMKTLGFKSKHVASIFSLLVAILLLGNLQFVPGVSKEDTAHVQNTLVLGQVARFLGVAPEDLEQALTNKTNYVRKELYNVLLTPEQSAVQRDQLVRDLYAILFAFVVETANHKLAPSSQGTPAATQIILLDQPGFQSRASSSTNSMLLTGQSPLIASHKNGFEDFCINFSDELVHSYVVRNVFEDGVGYNGHITGDGIGLPTIQTMDNSACVELLRGPLLGERTHRKPGGVLGVMNKACSTYKSGKSGDKRDEEMLQDLMTKFGVHASFIASPSVAGAADRNLFGINHYAGGCSYDVTGFVEKDADLLDSSFVTLLRHSSDPFVSKLVSGPSLSVETHYQDANIPVQAQVSSRPLRLPTPVVNNGMPPSEERAQLDSSKVYPITTQLNYNLSELLSHIDRARLWTVMCIRPNDSGSPNSFDKRRVKAQIRSLLLPDIVARRKSDFVVDYDQDEFCERYVPTMMGETTLRIRQCAAKNGWIEGGDYVVGHRSIFLSYSAWKMVEDPLRDAEKASRKGSGDGAEDADSNDADDVTEITHDAAPHGGYYEGSNDNLLIPRSGTQGQRFLDPNSHLSYGAGGLNTPPADGAPAYTEPDDGSAWGSEWDKKRGGPDTPGSPFHEKGKEGGAAGGLVVNNAPNTVEEIPTSRSRRFWLWIVWGFTWWIPSFVLNHVGRMKRPDIRLAWREKVTICLLIFLSCATILFYIIEFGRLLCPNLDKAWDAKDVAQHTGDNDFWVSVQGRVYDVSNFVHGDHSDIQGQASNGADILEELAGQDLTGYFPPPFLDACTTLVTDGSIALQYKNFTPVTSVAIHLSGQQQPAQGTKLDNPEWYRNTFVPKMNQFLKGPLVVSRKDVAAQAKDPDLQKVWAIYLDNVYDLTDYINTITVFQGAAQYVFLDSDIADVFKQQTGQDVTKTLNAVLATKDANTGAANMNCLNNAFRVGSVDFRGSPRCKVQNFLLLAFSSIIVTTIAAKFLAALQLSSKRTPEMLDKFVICQVPCYTEGEDSLRRTIDSLAALKYDDKRKLMFIICDGNIIGSGNDRPTPRIVLDILGVDPKIDPEPLLFKSVGEGARQLNYGKVYSGLYEFEGHVVPYIVIVKVGKPTERSKPGNRGKRDSQILVMHYLNRVHFDAPMSPLELEIYHQMRNVIGIDPAFYEYIFTVDADTSVTPDSLNRLIACCADDASVIGICGETKLDNEEGSWWTMIQVYEYYISHHLAKAFESLFGSVTCLPGCFSVYRIRTADKGRPIIISNRIIEDYADGNVDTLHKKNLFSLGEDRYLTTLLMKHFPTFRTKFTPDATAHTVAPESWSVLLSQRRRWINSTIHNLCELIFLPELCGFCCFSMRFIVFVDLLGTIILPATAVYLVYLIVTVSTGHAAIPIISLVLIGAVYGLQAIIFILKREFMLVGWMFIYILSYPVYSFFLPIYSFWCMDDFSWGNTRLVVGEGNNKKVVVAEDDKFDESMIPLKKFSEYEAEAWESGSHHSDETRHTGYTASQKPRSRIPSRPASPRSYHQASQSGDFYRDTNITYNNSSNPNLRLPNHASQQSLSQHGHGSSQHGHSASQHGHAPSQSMQFPAMSPYGMGMAPQLGSLPFLPYAGGPGSMAGSEYGGNGGGMMGGPQPFPTTTSMFLPAGPRNSVMTNLNMFGGGGSQSGYAPGPGAPAPSAGVAPQMTGQRPMSTFSIATTANPLSAGPSLNPDPSDDEVFMALRNYLSTQDLMTVTKKTAREAIMAKFPKADLASRKDFLNQSIDKILSES